MSENISTTKKANYSSMHAQYITAPLHTEHNALIGCVLHEQLIMCIEHYLKIHRKNEKRKRQERKCTKVANIIK